MSDSRGFTLIELLIAAGLLAVALLSMAAMFTSSYKNVGRGSEQTTGVMLASQQLEWLRTQPFASSNLTAGTTTTSFASPYAGFTRSTTIADNTPVAGMKQLTVQITMPSGRTARLVSFIGS